MKISVPILMFLSFLTSVTASAAASELALNWKPEPEFGGFYEAALNKLYEKAGAEIKILPGGAGQPVAQMVAGGKVRYGIVAADELILARAQGAKLVALFSVYQNDPQGFMVRKDRKIGSLKELFQSEGTIALQKGLPYTLWIEKQYAPLKARIVPYTGGVSQFLTDPNYAQQCFIFSEPIAARREKQDSKTFLISESGFNPYLAVLVTHEEALTKNAAEVKAVVKATREGWERYLKSPKATNVEMQKLNPSMDLGTFDEAARLQAEFIETKDAKKGGLGMMTAERWKKLYEQLVELKLVKAGMDPQAFFLKN
jgi:NitT/TauT family transport system substrate-binding protein